MVEPTKERKKRGTCLFLLSIILLLSSFSFFPSFFFLSRSSSSSSSSSSSFWYIHVSCMYVWACFVSLTTVLCPRIVISFFFFWVFSLTKNKGWTRLLARSISATTSPAHLTLSPSCYHVERHSFRYAGEL